MGGTKDMATAATTANTPAMANVAMQSAHTTAPIMADAMCEVTKIMSGATSAAAVASTPAMANAAYHTMAIAGAPSSMADAAYAATKITMGGMATMAFVTSKMATAAHQAMQSARA